MVALSMGSPFEIGFMENARLAGLAIVFGAACYGPPEAVVARAETDHPLIERIVGQRGIAWRVDTTEHFIVHGVLDRLPETISPACQPLLRMHGQRSFGGSVKARTRGTGGFTYFSCAIPTTSEC
jgi:hypothetical protein